MRFVNKIGRLKVTLALLGSALAIFLVTFARQDAVFAADDVLSAVYRNGSLELNIPRNAAPAHNGSLIVEIVDPTDKLVAKLPRPISTSGESGPWRVVISIDRKTALEDLAWFVCGRST